MHPSTTNILDVLDDYIDWKLEYEKCPDRDDNRRWHEYMRERKYEIAGRLDAALGEYVANPSRGR